MGLPLAVASTLESLEGLPDSGGNSGPSCHRRHIRTERRLQVSWQLSSVLCVPAILRILVNTTQIPAVPIPLFLYLTARLLRGWKPLPAAGRGVGLPKLIPHLHVSGSCSSVQDSAGDSDPHKSSDFTLVILAAVSNQGLRLLALCVVRILSNLFLCKYRQSPDTSIHPSVHSAFSCHFFSSLRNLANAQLNPLF